MRIVFRVDGTPPKKDGANSMWRKGSELAKLKALRIAASSASVGARMPVSTISLKLIVHAHPSRGDLDNFITGLCDGLMAAHPNTPIDDSVWRDVPQAARPGNSIIFRDDTIVSKVEPERAPPTADQEWYEVVISGE